MIYQIHLINGDDIVGFISNKTLWQQEFNIVNPLKVFEGLLESGKPFKILKRYIYNMSDSCNCIIKKNHIITMNECDEYFTEYYNSWIIYNKAIYDSFDKNVMSSVSSTLLKEVVESNKTQIVTESNTYH